MDKHVGTELKAAIGDLQTLGARLLDESRAWWNNRRHDMSRYEEDQQGHATYRTQGDEGAAGRGGARSSREWTEHSDRMRDEASFRGSESARQGGRAPFGPQPGREPELQDYAGYAETSSRSGAGRSYAREQYEDQGGFDADSQNAGRAGMPGHGSGSSGYRTGYSQGRHGHRRSAEADLGVSGYGQPERGQGGYGQYAGAGVDHYRGRQGQDDYGGFRGHGPKGYRRSDERIAEDLNERLTEDALLDASGIEVEVSEGVATLRGTVDSRWMKHRAEDIADGCSGVRDVCNEIRLAGAQPRTSTRSDPAGADGTIERGNTSSH
ncbi:BON domain-containing protein [Pseudoxanthomonas mexicana]|uniref:BON domain-containing protein n=1 Tax=Pseudoxanthomonas mexicana TaxID=128785 RepID=UPI0028B12FF2|nr:BON domain-containing protein [Pseudoxanthomonas mexicana]